LAAVEQGNIWSIRQFLLNNDKRVKLMLGTILLIVLVLLLVGALPSWPYSSNWGYGPSGLLGTVLVVFLILVLIGRV
jgi:hypothetical protein